MPEEFISYFSPDLVDEVIEVCLKALQNKPGDPSLHQDLAQAYFKKSMYAEARKAFSDAADLLPRNADLHLAVGRCSDLLGQYAEAERSFLMALDLQPEWPDTHYWMGKVQMELGHLEKAESFLLASIKLNDRFKDAFYSLAILYEKQERFQEAISVLKKIIAMPGLPDSSRNPFPYDLEPLFDDPILLNEAIRQLEASVKSFPSFADLHFKLGVAYRRKGDKVKALAELRHALRLNPSFHKARHCFWHWDDDQGNL